MKKWLLLITLAFISSSAVAFNESFLMYSPVSYFTKDDIKLFNNAKNEALNEARDNTKISWNNPSSGSHGYFVPSNTATQNGLTCRSLLIYSVANKVPGQSSYRVCKINGIWKVMQ